MEIVSLKLTSYRNFSQKIIAFDRELTVIVGANGSGKSNILESVAFLSGIRPTRVETDLDLVKFGKTEAKIEGLVTVDGEKKKLTVNFLVSDVGRVAKTFFVDSYKKRLFDFVSIFSVVVFEPADLDLVSGSPSLRRHHVDRFLASMDVDYLRNITAYGKVVSRRNKILQRIADSKAKPVELSFWDERLLAHAKFISSRRSEFFEFLNFVNVSENSSLQTKSQAFDKPSSGQEPGFSDDSLSGITWTLKQSLLTEEKLKNNRDRDIAAGVTLSGPHRDDFRFKIKTKDLEFFGSRGEQRMAVLALKLAELEYFRVEHGVRPVLVLDDIFSELDWEHREKVLAVIANQQTIITAAEKESIPHEIFKKAKVVQI